MDAIGIIINIGKNLQPEDETMEEFLETTECRFEGLDFPEDLETVCKFYDGETGELFVHFAEPMDDELLTPHFTEDEIIYPLE